MFIWFPYKTPDLSEPQYNTPLPKVHKESLGNDLGQFSFLLGLLYGFRITSQASRRSEGVYQAANTLSASIQDVSLNHRR